MSLSLVSKPHRRACGSPQLFGTGTIATAIDFRYGGETYAGHAASTARLGGLAGAHELRVTFLRARYRETPQGERHRRKACGARAIRNVIATLAQGPSSYQILAMSGISK